MTASMPKPMPPAVLRYDSDIRKSWRTAFADAAEIASTTITLRPIPGDSGRTIDRPRRMAAMIRSPNQVAVIIRSPKCKKNELLVIARTALPTAAADATRSIQLARVRSMFIEGNGSAKQPRSAAGRVTDFYLYEATGTALTLPACGKEVELRGTRVS